MVKICGYNQSMYDPPDEEFNRFNRVDCWEDMGWGVVSLPANGILSDTTCKLYIELPGGTQIPNVIFTEDVEKSFEENGVTYYINAINIWPSEPYGLVQIVACYDSLEPPKQPVISAQVITSPPHLVNNPIMFRGTLTYNGQPLVGKRLDLVKGTSGTSVNNATTNSSGQATLTYTPNQWDPEELDFLIGAYYLAPEYLYTESNILTVSIVQLIGILNCTSNPTGAGIYLGVLYHNMYYRGTTNMNITDLDPGIYNVEFTKDGYKTFKKVITIESGKTTYVSTDLILDETLLTGNISTNKTSYKQGEVVRISWSNVNFTGGRLTIYDPISIMWQSWIIDTPTGYVDYTLLSDATLSDLANKWTVYLSSIYEAVASSSFDVTETVPEFCTQYFRIEDQDGKPLAGYLTSHSWDIDVQVPLSGETSLYVQKGIQLMVMATVGTKFTSRTFTTCTTTPKIFVIELDPVIPTDGEIINITHKIVNNIGEDEITFDISVKNTSTASEFFYVDLRDKTGKFLERAPTITKEIGAGKTVVIPMSSVGAALPTWSLNDVINQIVTFELNTSNSIGLDKEIVDTVTYDLTVTSTNGEITNITHEIIKNIGEDEITFDISVKNTSTIERCYYIDLYDGSGKYIDSAPVTSVTGKFADKIKPGLTETIIFTSNWRGWSLVDVINQTVRFELRTIPSDALTGYCSIDVSKYSSVDTVTYDLTSANIIINVYIDNTEGLVTKNLRIGLLYVDPVLGITKTNVCNSPISAGLETPDNVVIATSFILPGPFTCTDKAYNVDSKFIAYADGFDDSENKYFVESSIVRSVYGTIEVSIKFTEDTKIKACYLVDPLDKTNCLITKDQMKALTTVIGLILVIMIIINLMPLLSTIGMMFKAKGGD